MAVSIKSPTSTTGAIQLNASDVLTIDSSGNLTAPNNLTVTGTVTQTGGATFNGGISGNVNFDSGTLYVDATNNRVGIGTSSPTNNLQIYNTGATSGQIHITNASTGATSSDGVLFGYDGSNDVIINNQEATQTKFYTNGTERMRIDSTGNVGIGTSSPSNKLDIFRSTFGGSNTSLILSSVNSASAKINYAGVGYNCAQGAAGIEAGELLFYTYGSGSLSERMRISNIGNVFIGCTTIPSSSVYGIQLSPVLTSDWSKSSAGSTGGIRHIGFYNPNGLVGGIETSGSATIFATSSDYRLKENVAPMSGSIDRLKQLKPSTWTWVNGGNGEGFLAHEAQTVVPEAISGTKDAMRTEEYEVTPAVTDDEGNVTIAAVMGTREVPDYQGIDQSKLVPLLTSALQEAITKIEDLETRIQALENPNG